eukprot:NODE_7131_length_791_cov_55.170659_g6892_i0.p1 GENE.NODE_7131_length_791_cov_55.170659_g6892_i0~~NODE_7131_length_791_cov_55.170659_g6892_i0.p1  ORF type:complete len:215 (-),score=29.68 NODE_7131_length_791_cov_55.170659_g6892_i0:52-696(-)
MFPTDGEPLKPTIILDIDGTLVFCPSRNAEEAVGNRRPDFMLNGGRPGWVRPGLSEFLQTCFECADVVIWTAAPELYTQDVLSKIMQSHWKYTLLHEDHTECEWKGSRRSIKDLYKAVQSGWIPSCDLARVVMVDDTPSNYSRNPKHGIPVPSFFGRPDTTAPDVRLLDHTNWRHHVVVSLPSNAVPVAVLPDNEAEIQPQVGMLTDNGDVDLC